MTQNLEEQHETGKMRTSFYDGTIKGMARDTYKFKQAVSIVKTSAWKNYFWREDPDTLTGSDTNTGKGIPRGAAFPHATKTFQRVISVIEKYGLEDNIAWEDLISDDVDVRDRTLLGIAEGVAKLVDDEIWSKLTGGAAADRALTPECQTITIAWPNSWEGSSAAIIDDLLQAKQLIAVKNYPVDNLLAFINPRDHRSIMTWLYDKGAQAPAIATDVAKNGYVGTIAGISLIISNSVTASHALVVVPKRVGTWKEMIPLTTITKDDPLKSLTIRCAEVGVTQLTDPNAAVLFYGTLSNF